MMDVGPLSEVNLEEELAKAKDRELNEKRLRVLESLRPPKRQTMLTIPEWLLRFIDWLNGKVGATHKAKPKQKHVVKNRSKRIIASVPSGIAASPTVIGYFAQAYITPFWIGYVICLAGVILYATNFIYKWRRLSIGQPKQKHTNEQMATLAELFDEAEPVETEQSYFGERPVIKPLGPSADTMR